MTEKIPYSLPSLDKTSFNCPHCNAFSDMRWSNVYHNAYGGFGFVSIENLRAAFCVHCENFTIWLNSKMIYPRTSFVDLPNVDLSEDIKSDYIEASNILSESPRGAAALLRLCIQKLCKEILKEESKDINKDIALLVERGLNVSIQKSLDTVRVVGNDAVHPGTIDLIDTPDIAYKLFKLVNFIAEKMISEPKQIESIYNSVLPEEKRKQIEERDKNKQA